MSGRSRRGVDSSTILREKCYNLTKRPAPTIAGEIGFPSRNHIQFASTSVDSERNTCSNRPLSALISNPSPRFLDMRSSRLIPRGIHGDRRTQDKPITNPFQRNKPKSSSNREPILEKTHCHTAPATQELEFPKLLNDPFPYPVWG